MPPELDNLESSGNLESDLFLRQDPMSHRIIEKRRRDRMNNCLADLSGLIPSNFLKKGRGRIEKTEIIEMAIKHLKQLQAHHCRVTNGCPGGLTTDQPEVSIDHFCLGYQECLSETMHFLVEIQVCYPGDPLCVQIMNHLQKHRERLLKGRRSRSPSKDSENDVGKRSTDSPDGSMLDRASPQPFCPSRNGLPPAKNSCLTEVTPKTEGNSLFDSADLSMKSCSDAADVQMSEPGEAKPIFGQALTNGGSQLREMLQNPLLQLAGRGRSMSASGSSRPFSTASSASNSTRGDCSEVFKYKRNIKERFKADQKVMKVNWDEGSRGSTVTEGATTSDERRFSEPMLEIPATDFQTSVPRTLESLLSTAPGKCSSLDSVLPVIMTARPDQEPSQFHSALKPLRETSAFVNGSQNLRQMSPPLPQPPPQDELPVFVLHPKGNFYVPMTIAASLVQPYLNLVPDVVPQLLHHVGLAAFFWNSGAVKIAVTGSDPMPSRCIGLQSPALHPWSSGLGCT